MTILLSLLSGDPCFRRYENSIIVNAQPYERRSSISLTNCKIQCLKSQIGIYSCRSFVYDTVNQVCDLFAHVGDQSPARLLRFQTRDYFEPTAAISCNSDALLITTTTFSSNLPESTIETTILKEQQNIVDANPFQNSILSSQIIETTTIKIESSCGPGKTARFLKTPNFELHTFDDVIIERITFDECLSYCSSNTANNGSSFKCNSFEYSESACILSSETAVPLGDGQLRQQQGTDYYEKFCVEELLARDCPSIYSRYPQMILVGFAETVVDASTLQQCFDNCLNSKKLYGFKCISGMYYFEEPQLNCILNTEDRFTQPDLFTAEATDIVDYFEIGCNSTLSGAARRFASPTVTTNTNTNAEFSSKKRDYPEKEAIQHGWSQWSECTGMNAIRQRTKICAQGKICGREIQSCHEIPKNDHGHSKNDQPLTKEEIVEAIRTSNCPANICCPIFGGCKIGIIQNPRSKRYEWCSNPCHKKRAAAMSK